jgi:hypothetical protein
MNQLTKNIKPYLALVAGLLTVACENEKASLTNSLVDTLVNVNYKTGTLDSGLTGINPTNATASDAAYIVGAADPYHIAHKVTLGIPGYYSNEAYRSESDADYAPNARYMPGDERRYEFSLLLKDWQEWNSSNPAYGDNVFQLKLSGGALVPVRILTKRNAIVTRNTTYQDDLVTDFRPYINQWIHFRIDVKWATTNTGYLKIYTKLPGQTSYNLVLDRNNYATYTGTPETLPGQHGYIKWGVYREAGKDANGNVILSDNALTRIAYHDDIRIIKLPLP